MYCPIVFPDVDAYQNLQRNKLANRLCCLLLHETWKVTEVQQLMKRLNISLVQNAFAFAMNRLITHYGNFIANNQLKGRIIELIELNPKCCLKGDLDYIPLEHFFKTSHLHLDKDILTAFLMAAPQCALHCDQDGFNSIHQLMQSSEPDYDSILLILEYCSQAACCRVKETNVTTLRSILSHPLTECDYNYHSYLKVLSALLKLNPQHAFEEITEVVTKMRVERAVASGVNVTSVSISTHEGRDISSLTDTILTSDSFDDGYDVNGNDDNMHTERDDDGDNNIREVSHASVTSTDTENDDQTTSATSTATSMRALNIIHHTEEEGSTQHEVVVFNTIVARVTVTWTPIIRMLQHEDHKIQKVAQDFVETMGHTRCRKQWDYRL